jgi:hypothetical protein
MMPETAAAEDARMCEIVRAGLTSQYHAGLEMLRQAVERCPDDIWGDRRWVNPTWRIAYHALYFTHLYLQPGERSFRPWKKHETWIQYMDDDPGSSELDDFLELPGRPPQTGEPYSRSDILEYLELCDAAVEAWLDALDLASDDGFSWHDPKRTCFEQQVASIRHLQLHATQLADRLPSTARVEWVGSRVRS